MNTRDNRRGNPPRPIPLLSLALGAAVLASALSGCGKEEAKAAEGAAGTAEAAKDERAAIRVVADTVESRPFEDWGAYSADLRGVQDAVLTAGMGGRVTSVDQVGKAVKAGQALCDIESSRYGAMLQQAKSALDVAKGDLDRAKANIDQAEFGYQQARVGYLQAQRAYEDSRCQAPFSGVLVSRMIENFQTVPPGAPTVRVASTDRLEAVVSIPEAEARDFREGQAAEFNLVQGGGKPILGKLKSIDRAVEERNRTVTARIEIPNPDNRLRPGMVGRARILRQKYDDAVVIPSKAVLRLQEGTAVMLVRDGTAQQVPVTLGPSSGDSVVVKEGLQGGETLITMGSFQVSTGTKVTY
jgi:membrane fusion protein (multidrug efflux system)